MGIATVTHARPVLAVGSDLRRRYKGPSVTIRVRNECFGAKIIFSWLLDDPVTSSAGLFDHSSSVVDLEMGIHAEPQLFPAPARFFPIPPAVPEKHADVARFQHWGIGRFEKIGIIYPHLSAPFVGAVETVCGFLLIFGLFTRPAALLLLINISVASDAGSL